MGTILVTGADGFIGSHLVEVLVANGYHVKSMVCYNAFGHYGWLDSIDPKITDSCEIVMGDIRDPVFVDEAVSGCSFVMHLAALIGIPFSFRAPDSYVDVNVKGTLNILNACRKHDVERLIHTSTSEVYGTAQSVPIEEAHPLVGQSPYSASKIAADSLALSYYYSFNLPVMILRPFNTFGPRQSMRAVIPTIAVQLLSDSRIVRLGDLTPTRDFTFVEDTALGFLAALRSRDIVGEVVNLGTGFEISIADLVPLIAGVLGVDYEIESDLARVRPAASEVFRLVSDNSKARNRMGWSPNFDGHEGLIRGLQATIEWLRANRVGGLFTGRSGYVI
ncbi:GDP-mannose 4,6-dehydratase [Litorivicinus sp.]|nr:GDP-mannose 4,6-dehydratase [Litorivicinus sp.]